MAATILSKKEQKRASNTAANEAAKGLMSGQYLFYIYLGAGILGGGAILQFINMLITTPFSRGATEAGPVAPVTVSIPEIDVKDASVVKHVLESGFPHVVYCVSNSTQASEAPQVIGEIKRKVEKKDRDTKLVAANCFEKSDAVNGTIAGVHNFGTREGFLAVFANQEPPLMLNYLSNAKYVANQILPKVKVSVKPITYLADWQQCAERKGPCFVLGGANKEKRDDKVQLVQPFVRSHRAIKFVTVDTGFWKVKADKALMSTRPNTVGQEDPVNAFCVYKHKKPDAVNVTSYGQFLRGWEDESALKAFFDDCMEAKPVEDGESTWAVLEEYPTVKAKEGKTKVIKRTKNPDAPEEEANDGTKAGAGERVGRRKTEEEEDDDDDDWAGGEGDDETADEEEDVEEEAL